MAIRKTANRLRGSFREYFTFTQSELRGTIALIVIIGLIVGLRWALPFMHKGKLNRLNSVTIQNPDSLIAVAASLERNADTTKNIYAKDFRSADVEIEKSKFAFDPNTVSFPDLLRLGFNRKVANNIISYRSKGGKFKSSNDLLKIYNIDSGLVAELEPFVMFPEATVANEEKKSNPNYSTTYSIAKSAEIKTTRKIDINTADSATLTTINGIGPTFASRIIKLRNRLGAFVSKEQLKDVYGLTPEHYQIIEPNVIVQTANVKKININTSTLDELKLHSYFNYKMAKAVITYREQHGNYQSIEDLKNVEQIDPAFYEKIKLYVATE